MDAEISKLLFTADTWPLKRRALTVTATERRVLREIRHTDGQTVMSEGVNGYPDEWQTFMAMCEYCGEISEIEYGQQQ